MPELIAHARAHPGEVTYGTSGNGSLPHLAGELFASMASVRMIHVPYRGSAPAMIDLAGGRIAISIDTLSTGLPQIQAGRVKPLAVTGPGRSTDLPNLPTVAETLPGYTVINWHGMVAPARTPPEVVNRVSQEVADALADPEIRGKIRAQGIEPLSSTPSAFATFMATESVRWAKVIQDAGIRIE
jgi:tripartite-type tricarboxylate transporter receptor subunit TctC